jgi:hypothetical protein
VIDWLCVRRLGLLLVVAGCNQIYGLDETYLTDGHVARRCPAIGETPVYTTAPQTLTSGEFPFDYTFDEARTFAVAYRVNAGGIVEAPVDSADFVPLDLDADAGDRLFDPRVAPEGDQLVVRVQNAAGQWNLRLYTRSGVQSWQRGPTLTSLLPAERCSTPSRRSTTDERRFIRLDPTGSELAEYTERVGVWSLVRTYDRATLGVSLQQQIEDPQLSPDGLRLVFTVREIVGRPIYFTDRASIDDAFRPASLMLQLTGDSEPQDPFMVQDCTRLYMVVYPGLIYVEQ